MALDVKKEVLHHLESLKKRLEGSWPPATYDDPYTLGVAHGAKRQKEEMLRHVDQYIKEVEERMD